VACLLGALLLIWYPLRGERLERIKAEILDLHRDKKQRLIEKDLENES
jgi:hypothetical protein